MNGVWSAEETAVARDMWAAGKSATLIADALGDWATRSAVLGKINRLGLLHTRQTTETSRAPRKQGLRIQRLVIPAAHHQAIEARSNELGTTIDEYLRRLIARDLGLTP